MKLKDVKDGIDNYFDNISADKLYEISLLKYGFSEITFELEDEPFQTSTASFYRSTDDQSVFGEAINVKEDNLPLAA